MEFECKLTKQLGNSESAHANRRLQIKGMTVIKWPRFHGQTHRYFSNEKVSLLEEGGGAFRHDFPISQRPTKMDAAWALSTRHLSRCTAADVIKRMRFILFRSKFRFRRGGS